MNSIKQGISPRHGSVGGVPRRALCLSAMLLAALMAHCNRQSAPPGGGAMQVPDLGLSMSVPSGWTMDRANPRMCSRAECTGIIMDEPLAGKDFAKYVDTLSQEMSARRVSFSPSTVSGREAVEAVVEYPAQGTTALKVYIHKDASLIELSFVVPTAEFPIHEPSLRESVKSISLK